MLRKRSIPLVAAAAISLGAFAWAQAEEAAPAPSPAPETTPHTAPKKKVSKPIPPPAPAVPTPQSGPGAFDAEKRLATLTARLKLSPEQQAKIKPILEETELEVKDIRANTKKPLDARDKVKVVLESADNRMRVVLDGNQKEEWEKMKAEVKQQTRTPFMATTLE